MSIFSYLKTTNLQDFKIKTIINITLTETEKDDLNSFFQFQLYCLRRVTSLSAFQNCVDSIGKTL